MPAALVTGAAVRIGRAIAESLAADGWAVAINYHHSRGQADEVAGAIARAGGRAIAVQCDLADLGALQGLVTEATDALGPITLLVNNAAIFEDDAVGRLEPDLWRRQLDTNLAAPVFLSQAFADRLPDGKFGNIVNIVDQRVWKPVPAFMSYQMSKSALWAATISLAQALAPWIRVNAVGPGPVLPSPRQTEADFAGQIATLPLERGPTLAEFGEAIKFLVATPSITGQMIALDGGQHLAWKTPDVTGFTE